MITHDDDNPSLDNTTTFLNIPLNNSSALEAAAAKIETYMGTLHYPQQRAVLKDNVMPYIKVFADYYYKSNTRLKTKDNWT